MKFVYTILPLFVIVIYSCNPGSSKATKIRRIGNDRRESWILPYITSGTDTLTDGNAICYSRTGKIKEEIEYKKGLKEGWDRQYDSSGTLENRIVYKNGFKMGTVFFIISEERLGKNILFRIS